MNKFVKWFGIILSFLIILLIALSGVGIVRANQLLTQKWDYLPDSDQIPMDAESVTLGVYLTIHIMLYTSD